MTYSFTEHLFQQGNRHFIKIPFNVWEECGQTGLVPVKVCIQNCLFECKLVPKGRGFYCIPVAKVVANQLGSGKDLSVSFEVIRGLTRINHDSPYSRENPIRKIDGIQRVTDSRAGYCGQICVAQLTGLSVDEIAERMQAKAWQCSFSKLLETLDYYGISYADQIIYTRGYAVTLPECCIVTVKDEKKNHFALCYKGKYYDATQFDADQIISYLKIPVA